MDISNENTSGSGKNAVVPHEIKGWNWGAFLLNWIWGIGNSTYIALLTFIPLFGIVMIFVLGFKRNEWAWRNRVWRDVEHFKQTQKKWAVAGVIFVFVIIPLIFIFVTNLLKGEAYDLSLAEIESNVEVIQLLGSPIEPGIFITGNIRTSGPDGDASLMYSVSGPNGEADAFVKAYKDMNKWILEEVVVYSEDKDHEIQVIGAGE